MHVCLGMIGAASASSSKAQPSNVIELTSESEIEIVESL